MKAREDQDAPEVIAGIFSLYDIKMNALIGPSSTNSYACIEHVFDKITSVGRLLYYMHVTSHLGQSVKVNRVYKNCPIVIQNREFSTDLIALPFYEFDLILRMDWLSKHWDIIDCDKKIVGLRCSDQSEVIVHGVRSNPMSNVISAMQARRLLRKGCEAFLALMLDFKRGQIELENILVVKDFSDVFPEELPGIPPENEVDLSIKILLGTSPTSRAPYRITPTKLKELKFNYKSFWIKGLSDPVFLPRVHLFCS